MLSASGDLMSRRPLFSEEADEDLEEPDMEDPDDAEAGLSSSLLTAAGDGDGDLTLTSV
jgi:hypothetical protein